MRLETRQIVVTVVAIAGFLSLGGCVGKPKEQTKPINYIASSSTKEAIKQKQLTYLKEHEQEMTTYVKEHNANIHQVSYDWDRVRTVVGGNGTPQGGDEMILIFGGFNQNPESSWRVDVVVEDGKINLKTMSLGQYLRMGGRIFE
ncbi:MAG: lipoprotein BUG3 [Streptococcus parasanguinis]|nr:lipoprotein BUG3 [Streptococcus parasanguinis]